MNSNSAAGGINVPADYDQVTSDISFSYYLG